MGGKTVVLWVSVFILAACTGWADDINGITMNFATIGNPGNPADTDIDPERNGYGSVSYTYRIGITEVSIAHFAASGISDGNANYWNDGTRTLGPNAPVVSISWHEAARFCNWLTSGDVNTGAYTIDGSGNVTAVMSRAALLADGGLFYVLPTENEWYKAAYYNGVGYALYANGSGTPPVHGVEANFDTAGGYNDGPAWTVGSGSNEVNGTLNMMGNVWEWLESADDGILDSIGEEMAFRGGDYFQGSSLLAASSRGNGELASGEFLNTGMRIVAIPEPGTMSLMSLSTLGLFLSRSLRRRKMLGKSLIPVGRERRCDSYCTLEEWERVQNGMVEDPDMPSIAWEPILIKARHMQTRTAMVYRELDKRFWNHMVVIHERRTAKREAFKAALKKRALNGLDAFLALFMK